MDTLLWVLWMLLLYAVLIPFVLIFLLSMLITIDSMGTFIFRIGTAYLISGIVFAIVVSVAEDYREYEHKYTHNLVALQDSETMIVSRNAGYSQMYYYYMISEGGSYKSKQSDQAESTLRYTDEQPRVEVYKKESNNKFIYFLMPVKTYARDYRYDFYIPEGTIKEEFEVDLN